MVDRELVPSCQKAQALLMAGLVLVDEVPVTKAGKLVKEDAAIRIRGEDHPYVSRGGVKLDHAIREFGCDIKGKVCMDVGASTGGFTDCLLKCGAAKVYAVDVGYGQLSSRIANDSRVVVIDRQNIRNLEAGRIPEKIDVVTADVSFISLELVLPVIDRFLIRSGIAITLIKPQFEVGRELVGKGGIVKDPSSHKLAVDKVVACAEKLGWTTEGVTTSPIEGAKGNKEFLALFRKK
jgi:23S rRNA (cytidine1920-2'-O)/16S rRNA (cytidine1409-2'-O)-methyltransferase